MENTMEDEPTDIVGLYIDEYEANGEDFARHALERIEQDINKLRELPRLFSDDEGKRRAIEHARTWRAENRECVTHYQQTYCANHREALREYNNKAQRACRARKKAAAIAALDALSDHHTSMEKAKDRRRCNSQRHRGGGDRAFDRRHPGLDRSRDPRPDLRDHRSHRPAPKQ
jgi:hypothetical protein